MKKLLIFSICITSKIFATNSVILVGTTGDYPPVTYVQDGKYQGYDIKIIEDFAKDNNLNIKFVKTSWSNLSKDLLNNNFTIAVGGIDANTERKQLFLISAPIRTSSKVPLVRCEEVTKFNSFSKINTPNTRVVENLGGTNQKFAQKNAPNANIIIVKNNKLPFIYILQKKADVMFTDNLEAKYIHQKEPNICIASLTQKFPSGDKVFLFNKTANGQKLQSKFNSWWLIHRQLINYQ